MRTGTNYSTTNNFSGVTITLDTPLPGATTQVIIDYGSGPIQRITASANNNSYFENVTDIDNNVTVAAIFDCSNARRSVILPS
jgi:hypothetical protein